MPEWFPLQLVVQSVYSLLPWGCVALLGGFIAGTVLLVAGLPRR